jgi:murein DD-endopeptidase MepM/ murein hydrolase activator NlpD
MIDVDDPRPYTTEHHKTALERARDAFRALVAAQPLPPLPPRGAVPLAELDAVQLGGAGWVWPMADARDGTRAQVSDGFHTKADLKAGRAKRTHRGVDIMYWSRVVLPPDHPYVSPSGRFHIPIGTFALAAGPGVVTVSRKLATGWAVCIDHGSGVETAYHHMFGAEVEVGKVVRAGQRVGLVGGTPASSDLPRGGLVHLHFDLVVKGKFVDPEPYLRTWPHLVVPRPTSRIGGIA